MWKSYFEMWHTFNSLSNSTLTTFDQVVRNMDVNKHERLSNITLRHKLEFRNIAFMAVLHFTVTAGFLDSIPTSFVSKQRFEY